MWKSRCHLGQETRRCHSSNYIQGRLNTRLFSACRGEVPTRRGRELERTSESDEDNSARETRHSFRDAVLMTRGCLTTQRRWSRTISDTKTHIDASFSILYVHFALYGHIQEFLEILMRSVCGQIQCCSELIKSGSITTRFT